MHAAEHAVGVMHAVYLSEASHYGGRRVTACGPQKPSVSIDGRYTMHQILEQNIQQAGCLLESLLTATDIIPPDCHK